MAEVLRGAGPYGDGRDEADVRACWCCKPRGSFRLVALERRMTEPIQMGQHRDRKYGVVLLTRNLVGIGAQNPQMRLLRRTFFFARLARSVWRFPSEESRHGVEFKAGPRASGLIRLRLEIIEYGVSRIPRPERADGLAISPRAA